MSVENLDKRLLNSAGILSIITKDFQMFKFRVPGQEEAFNVAASIEALSTLGEWFVLLKYCSYIQKIHLLTIPEYMYLFLYILMYDFMFKKLLKTIKLKKLMFSLKEVFAILLIDKAGNNLVFICKHFSVLAIIKEVNYAWK